MATTSKTPLWRKVLKITAWTLMALVLLPAAALLCCINLLEPAQLTPITERIANRLLDADVTIGSVDLSLHGRAPFVKVDIDSLTVISRPMQRLRAAGRDDIPLWADTLLTLDKFSGSINPIALLGNRIDLHDVVFTAPRIQIFTVDEDHSNYLIYTSTDTTKTSSGKIPALKLDRFRLEKCHPLRFANLSTGEHFTIALSSLDVDGEGSPLYKLEVGGDFNSPSLGLYNLDRLKFGVDGGLGWESSHPSELELRQFKLFADFISATVNAHVDLGHDIIVRDFDIELGNMEISRILDVIPDSIRNLYELGPDKFSTDIALSFKARSTAPFNITTDSIPYAELSLVLDPGALNYGRADFKQIGGVIDAVLMGNDLDAATFRVNDLIIEGPATELHINSEVTRVRTDPLISIDVKGTTKLQQLPVQLRRLIGGSLRGQVDLDLNMRGTPSMLSRQGFHRLHVKGAVDGHDIFYLAADTNTMVYTDRVSLKFGANERFGHVDSLLTAVLKIDSTQIITGDGAMTMTGLTLGAGVSNRYRSADTLAIVPFGGSLELKTFDLSLLGHTTTMRARDIDGKVNMRRYNDNARQPLFNLNLGINRISFGSATSRMMFSGSRVEVEAHKIPGRKMPRAVKATADSLRVAFPEMSLDSVYAYALEKHRPRPGHLSRVHPEYTEDDSEIIYWGTATFVKRLLLDWAVQGNFTSRRASLFTATFPIRNRMQNLNATFNNDSVVLTNVKYKAGSSDFLISGRLSNMRRAFTSPGYKQPLRINFSVLSDTIDINELAGTAFRGAAVSESLSRHKGEHKHFNLEALEARLETREEEADSLLEHEIGRMVADAPDSVSPLLIPSNIDLRLNINAANVRYADIQFKDFAGELLAYNGAVNLHHLTAASEMGSLNLSALYSATKAEDMKFGFGLEVNDFNIKRFMRLVPAVDSMMPILRDVSGIISAQVAATCDIDRNMNLELPSLAAAIRLEGDSLELIDAETYRNIGKWLLFKDKQRNIIDHLNMELTVSDNMLRLYPVIFNIDRYKLGIQGYNDMAMNFDYHVAVLKSPLPFRFGINIKGNPAKYKIRLGKAHFDENLPTKVAIVDTTRVNLLREIENVFRRGVAQSQFRRLNIARAPEAASIDLNADTISAADSAVFIKEGLIPAPEPPHEQPASEPAGKRKRGKNKPATPQPSNREATLSRKQ